jgi:hypothetical protein
MKMIMPAAKEVVLVVEVDFKNINNAVINIVKVKPRI